MKILFSRERLSRLLVSLLLFSGLYLPLVYAFSSESALLSGLLVGFGIVILLWVLTSLIQWRWIGVSAIAVLLLVQLIFPSMGFIGIASKAVKAISLYINGAQAAAPVFSKAIGLFFGVLLALLAYSLSHPSAGFLPATICVVLMFYAVWSFSKGSRLWFSAPALIALLLLISRTSHRRSNLLEVVPVASAVVIISILLLPSGHTAITPLYNAAMDLKQTIEDYLFFTDARNVFSIGNYGWYPMGASQLGGAVDIKDTPALMVKSDQKVLLRCVTKDEYTGRSWQDTEGGKRYLYINPRWTRLRQSVFLEDTPPLNARNLSDILDEKAISVQVQNTGASTLPVPAYLRSFVANGDLVAYFNDSAELFTTRDLQRDDRYTAFAPIVEGGGSSLGTVINAVSGNFVDTEYEKIRAHYTVLPDHLESKVFEDARKMTADYTAPYEKVCAIYRNLQKYYKYTLSPDTPPENQDFVTFFLYVGKEGYSTYFASAMAVLCRMNDIPARYVEGFVCIPSTDGFCYVTEKNARAWVEVYFSGFGWVPFDPTPTDSDDQEKHSPNPSPSPSPTPPSEEPQATPTPPPEIPPDTPETDPPENENSSETSEPFKWWIWALFTLMAALIVRAYQTSPSVVAKHYDSIQNRVYVYGAACARLLANWNIVPEKSETPMRFARRADELAPGNYQISKLWQMMSVSRYSGRTINEKGEQRAIETYHAIWKDQVLWHKLRFRLQCMFTNKTYHILDTRVASVKELPKYPSVRYRSDGKTVSRKQPVLSNSIFRPPVGYTPPRTKTPEEIENELSRESNVSIVKHSSSTESISSNASRRRRITKN